MSYLLDTNVCIVFLSQRSAQVSRRFMAVPESEKIVCSIVRAELFYGAHKSQQSQASLQRIRRFLANLPTLPFDDIAALYYGQFRAELARQGTPIGQHDLQIAAIAAAHNLTLVTHNTREFSRIPNLQLEDWEI